MKNIKNYILESNKHISDRMFIKALKKYGEITHDDLLKIYGEDYDDNPLTIQDKPIDSMYVGKGVGLCFAYKENGRDLEYSNQSIEDYDYEDIEPLYNYIINNG